IEGRGKRASELGLVAYYALLPFAAAGLVAVHRARRPLSPFIGIALAVTVTAALTFGLTRYRAPVDLEVALLAGLGADLVLAAVSDRRRSPDPDAHVGAAATPRDADVTPPEQAREDGPA
ncbi:hypothetical protein B7486_55920, partial [cyanobacterium TDX16]